MEKCGFCGFENSDNMHFCRKCGKPLSVNRAKRGGAGKKAGRGGKSGLRAAMASPGGKAKVALALAVLAAAVIALFFLDSKNAINIEKFTSKEGTTVFTGGSGATDEAPADEEAPEDEAPEDESAADEAPTDGEAPADESVADEAPTAESSDGEAAQGDESATGASQAGEAPAGRSFAGRSFAGEASDDGAEADGAVVLSVAEAAAQAIVWPGGGESGEGGESAGEGEGQSFGELFEFLQLAEVIEPDGRYLSVALRNKSATDFAPMKIEFEMYDGDHAVVGRESAENEHFFAFNAWVFKIRLDDEAKSFSISSVELNGFRSELGGDRLAD